jgi:HAD superfamily hydrolase (TIGR01490 family)
MQLVLFDLDHTLIPFDSGSTWFRYLTRRGVLDAADFEAQNLQFANDYLAGKLDIAAFQRFCMSVLARYSRADLDAWRRDFIEEISEQIPQAGRALVRHHLERGDLCCIVTATNHFVAGAFAEIFGITHLVASQARTEQDNPAGRFTGEMVGVASFGAGKVPRVMAWLSSLDRTWSEFERTLFYSDSTNDLPLLSHVSHPLVVSPDTRLRETAQERGWPIFDTLEDAYVHAVA